MVIRLYLEDEGMAEDRGYEKKILSLIFHV